MFTQRLSLDHLSSHMLAALCGECNKHLQQIESRLNLDINQRGDQFSIHGKKSAVNKAVMILKSLVNEIESGEPVSPDSLHLTIQQYLHSDNAPMSQDNAPMSQDNAPMSQDSTPKKTEASPELIIKTKKTVVKYRGDNQQKYLRSILTHDINFGVGPAGTGKTYLAVACAVQALLKDEVERILLVRPAVEAGEKLGFLPGDLSQKVDPYLRPLFDALYEMLGFEMVDKLIERNIIEVAPLAYMRGRTLNNAFVILDESQNTTREQMKMFLTRIGFGTTAVINGDPTQIDLARGQASGLEHALKVLDQVSGVSVTQFISKDVVRHPIVQRIVDAYEAYE